jgi:hypothetical protein
MYEEYLQISIEFFNMFLTKLLFQIFKKLMKEWQKFSSFLFWLKSITSSDYKALFRQSKWNMKYPFVILYLVCIHSIYFHILFKFGFFLQVLWVLATGMKFKNHHLKIFSLSIHLILIKKILSYYLFSTYNNQFNFFSLVSNIVFHDLILFNDPIMLPS